MLGDKCFAATHGPHPLEQRESAADPTSSAVSSPLPLPSATVSLLLHKRRARVWAAPAEPMCSTEMFPLPSAADPLLLSD